jgi:hypothetical protein
MATILFLAALGWGILLIVMGFISALRKLAKNEEHRITRLDEAMKKGSRDDPNEPARFVP